MTATLQDTRTFVRSRAQPGSGRRMLALEVVAVLAAPPLLYALLRLRGMAPLQLPDPSMHTTFILDPHAIFDRYQAVFDPTARLREAARVGFLVPARISYLLFGAVPGFFVFRYLLALVAIGPLYLLLRRLYGRWAGFIGAAVVMSSPVVITALGTDYPDSAVVSYMTGGLAALGLSVLPGPRQRVWLAASGVLFSMAIWSHGAAVPLVAAAGLVYLAVRWWRDRPRLALDVGTLLAVALLTTLLVALGSWVLLGRFDFVKPTIRSAQFLSHSDQVSQNHSAGWGWAPYDAYLLVPPALLGAFAAVFARRWRELGTVPLLIGLICALQLLLSIVLQFLWTFQILEEHYFSSTLWASTCVVLALTIAELSAPLLDGRRLSISAWPGPLRGLAYAVPTVLVLAVALAYEATQKLGISLPTVTWLRGGLELMVIIVAAAALPGIIARRGRAADDGPAPARRSWSGVLVAPLASTAAIVVIAGGALVLTVAPHKPHRAIANVIYDPYPAYDKALGGNDDPYEAVYRVIADVPRFVGRPSYRGEVMLTWEPPSQYGRLLGPMGLYHNAFTWLSESFPRLSHTAVRNIAKFHAGQVLLMSLTGNQFPKAVRALSPYQPLVVRRDVISHGWYHLYIWLIDLRRTLRAHAV